jgi:hypothetical protein
MCAGDEQMSRLLHARRASLRALFQELQPDIYYDQPSVLVDSQMLIRYISCTPVQESDDDYAVCGQALLLKSDECGHQMVHPRDVRRAKILPKSVFDRLAAIIDSETGGAAESEAQLPICAEFLAPESSVCKDCAEMHVIELVPKLDLLEKQKELLSDLDQARAEAGATAEQDFVYAVSRAFDKQFRAHMQRLVKAIADPKLNSVDALDLSTIEYGFDQSSEAPAAVTKNGHAEINEESLLNYSITCESCTVLPCAEIHSSLVTSPSSLTFFYSLQRPAR